MTRIIETVHPATEENINIKIIEEPEENSDHHYKYVFIDENKNVLDDNIRYMKKEDFEDMYIN